MKSVLTKLAIINFQFYSEKPQNPTIVQIDVPFWRASLIFMPKWIYSFEYFTSLRTKFWKSYQKWTQNKSSTNKMSFLAAVLGEAFTSP